MKSSFMNEEIIVQKSDGRFSQKLFAVISRFTIIAEDAGVKIEAGDLILRHKRDGSSESYQVLTADLKTLNGGPANYQMRVRIVDDNASVTQHI